MGMQLVPTTGMEEVRMEDLRNTGKSDVKRGVVGAIEKPTS